MRRRRLRSRRRLGPPAGQAAQQTPRAHAAALARAVRRHVRARAGHGAAAARARFCTRQCTPLSLRIDGLVCDMAYRFKKTYNYLSVTSNNASIDACTKTGITDKFVDLPGSIIICRPLFDHPFPYR